VWTAFTSRCEARRRDLSSSPGTPARLRSHRRPACAPWRDPHRLGVRRSAEQHEGTRRRGEHDGSRQPEATYRYHRRAVRKPGSQRCCRGDHTGNKGPDYEDQRRRRGVAALPPQSAESPEPDRKVGPTRGVVGVGLGLCLNQIKFGGPGLGSASLPWHGCPSRSSYAACRVCVLSTEWKDCGTEIHMASIWSRAVRKPNCEEGYHTAEGKS
jgi:hypothetical protein